MKSRVGFQGDGLGNKPTTFQLCSFCSNNTPNIRLLFLAYNVHFSIVHIRDIHTAAAEAAEVAAMLRWTESFVEKMSESERRNKQQQKTGVWKISQVSLSAVVVHKCFFFFLKNVDPDRRPRHVDGRSTSTSSQVSFRQRTISFVQGTNRLTSNSLTTNYIHLVMSNRKTRANFQPPLCPERRTDSFACIRTNYDDELIHTHT